MASEEGFIAAIAESPDDEAPCLVFADWLEERGDTDRSDFIRLQCQLARMDPADVRYPDLHLRQLELLAAHEQEWLGEWSRRLVRWEFKRGLLHSVTVTPEPFLQHGNDLFARHPVGRVAFVNDAGESLQADAIHAVVSAPAMRHVQSLETAGCRPDEPMWGMYGGSVFTNVWLTALVSATHVTRLQVLSFTGGTRMGRQAIDLDVWRDFCQAPHLRTIRSLDLSDAYHTEGFDGPDRIVSTIEFGRRNAVHGRRGVRSIA
jgi:uncharacterized protein (TIGR02996 family)